MVAIPLTPMAIVAINGALGTGKIAMGGRMTTLSGALPDEFLFAFTDLWKPHMVGKEPILELIAVAVPEARGWMLIAAVGVGALVVLRSRRSLTPTQRSGKYAAYSAAETSRISAGRS